jgi:hypothetical protein
MRRFLFLSAVLSFAAECAFAQAFYVDGEKGNDSAAGGKDAPFQTIARAIKEVDGVGGEVHLVPGKQDFRDPVIIFKGGTAEKPLIVDGHGAVINLGTDVTAGPWTDTGDGWRLERDLPEDFATGSYQSTPVFVNGIGILGDHPKGPSYAPRAKHGGYLRLDENRKLVLVFPQGLSPKNSVIVLTGGPEKFSSAVRLQTASNVTVRNVTSTFSENDGFNFHGHGTNVFIENCKALFNADEGVSAHETYEVEVRDTEIAFNGSQGGGVHDVNDCTTTYKNVRTHQNRASGFAFQGRKHTVEGGVSYGNGGRNVPKPAENTTIIGVEDLGPLPFEIPVVEDPSAPFEPEGEIKESNILGRFLELRPPTQ